VILRDRQDSELAIARLRQSRRPEATPARLQKITRGPLLQLLPRGCELWLDGGHNPAAGEVLAAWAKTHQPKPVYVIAGMLKSKDSAGFFKPLAPHAAPDCRIANEVERPRQRTDQN